MIKNRCWASVWSFLGLNLMYAMSKLDINFVCNPPRYTVASKIPLSVSNSNSTRSIYSWRVCNKNYFIVVCLSIFWEMVLAWYHRKGPWGIMGGGSPMVFDPMKTDKSLFWLSDSNSTGSIYPQRVSTRRVFFIFYVFCVCFLFFVFVCICLNVLAYF